MEVYSFARDQVRIQTEGRVEQVKECSLAKNQVYVIQVKSWIHHYLWIVEIADLVERCC